MSHPVWPKPGPSMASPVGTAGPVISCLPAVSGRLLSSHTEPVLATHANKGSGMALRMGKDRESLTQTPLTW